MSAAPAPTEPDGRGHAAGGVAVGVTAGLIAVAIWAAWIAVARFSVAPGLAGEGAPAPFTPTDIAFLRNLGPALLLAPVWFRPSLRECLAPRQAPLWTIPALCAWGAPFAILISLGLARADSALAGALAPAFMPLLAALILAVVFAQRPSRPRAFGLMLIAAGAALFLGGRLAGDPAAAASLAGAPFLLSASLCWACYTVAFPSAGLSPHRAVGIVGVWSTAAAGLALLAGAESRLGDANAMTLALGFLAHGVAAGVISVVAFSIAIDRLGPGRAAAFGALVPGAAALIGWAWLGDPFSAVDMAALGIASVGVLLVNAGPPRAAWLGVGRLGLRGRR